MARMKRLATCGLAILIALMMAVMVPSAEHDQDAKKASMQATGPSVLKIGFLQKIDSLNPYVGFSDAAYVYYGLVYDTLMSVGNDMEIVPNLALSWYPVPTSDPEMIASGEPFGSVWQYNITPNAYFTDGSPVTADDVVFSINLNAGNYSNIWAYQPYSFFMKYAENHADHTVRIHFYDRATGDPCPAAYGDMISIPILPKHKLESLSPLVIGFSWNGVFDDEPNQTVGTGPFRGTPTLWDDWLNGGSITLVRNPNCHWSTDYGMNVSFDEIQLVFFDDVTTMSLLLENGGLDVASFPPPAYYSIKNDVEAGTLKNVETFDGPKITQYWTEVGFNMNYGGPNPSRLDPVIRQAMAMTTNKDYIVSQFYLGLAEPGSTLIPPFNEYWHYNLTEAEKFPLDYNAARENLTAGGYIDTNSDGYRECTATSLAVVEGWVDEGTKLSYDMLVRREYPEEKQIAQYLQQEWANIGINLVVDIVDEVQLNTVVYYYQYDMMLWYWSADIDPNYQLFVESKAAWNGWSDNLYYNPAYDENYTESVMEMDRDQRRVYVDNCQRIHYRDAAYIILAYTNQTYAWRNDTFTGWGDWAADPGRSVDNFWTGNPLWFDLIPLNPHLVASFSVSPATGTVATVFQFNASETFANDPQGNVEIRWDWESDGVADTDWSRTADAQHQFASPGTYHVKLMARNLTAGWFNNATQTVVVANSPPEASFWVSTLIGDNSTVFQFDASWSSDLETPLDELMVRWDWNGDGDYDTSWTTVKTAAHVFSVQGTYDVTLQVKDAANETGQWVIRVTVQDVLIPEFPALMVPVLGMAGVAIVLAIRRKRGSAERHEPL